MASVSIVIPCYNSATFLPATVQSVLQQSLVDWECMIVDDGSNDLTWQIASQYASQDSRIQVIRQHNSGRALALNYGCKHTDPTSPYLFFLDSDDCLEGGALRELSNYLDKHHEACVAACDAQLIDELGRPIEGLGRSRWAPTRFLLRKLQREERLTPFATFYCGTGQGPFAMHRRSAFEKTGGFDARFSEFSLHEDTDIFCQMALLGEVHYLPDRLYRTRRHGGNVSEQGDKVQFAYSRFRAKWDSYAAPTPEQQRVVEAARRFYYGTFRPFRNVKVALNMLKWVFSSRETESLPWIRQLLKEAAFDFVKARTGF